MVSFCYIHFQKSILRIGAVCSQLSLRTVSNVALQQSRKCSVQTCVFSSGAYLQKAEMQKNIKDSHEYETWEQDRILPDGVLRRHNPQQPSPSSRDSNVSQAQRIGVPLTAPAVAPASQLQLDILVDYIQGSKRLVIMSGAGCSTESNIPDYRGVNGAYSTGFKPMTHQQFMASPATRARYWARSFAGWHSFSSIEPNAAHESLARLQQRGWLDAIITQIAAGKERERSDSDEMEEIPVVRPDGDVELQDAGRGFLVPPCRQCGGFVKPNVVFFGDGIPKERAARAMEVALSCDAMLVVGSSLQVYSAYRLAKAALSAGAKMLILSSGRTRIDNEAHYKVEALAGETLARLAAHYSLLIPRAVVPAAEISVKVIRHKLINKRRAELQAMDT